LASHERGDYPVVDKPLLPYGSLAGKSEILSLFEYCVGIDLLFVTERHSASGQIWAV